jgi:pyruvate dehydrogenase E2 component (dihydrolipoamide acetyltransferase)
MTVPQLQGEQQAVQVTEGRSTVGHLPRLATRVSASPRAKRLSKQLGVDLSTVKGSRQGGRILEQDVRRAAKDVPGQAIDADRRRRGLIAEKMTLSIQTLPHFALSVEVNAERFLSVYECSKDNVHKNCGLKLTLTDKLLRACGMALRSTPGLNATWRDNTVVPQTSIHLGLAVAADQGVVGPVIRDVDRMELNDLVASRTQLVDKARRGHIAISDLEGGVGTLSNLGMYRVDHFRAIITPGQCFALAVGRICRRPWAESTLYRPAYR